MSRLLLVLLVLLLCCLGFVFYAFVSYDPSVESALDRSDDLPEGKGFAPRPSPERWSAKVSVGRWMREWVDGQVGEAKRRGPRLDDVRVLTDPVALGRPGGLRVRVRRADGGAARGIAVAVYVPAGVLAQAPRWTDDDAVALFDGLPSGPGYVVQATESGHGERVSVCAGVEIRADGVRDLVITLPGGTIHGQVTDRVTGDPVPHAVVWAGPSGPGEAPEPEWALFGAAGVHAGWHRAVADGMGRFQAGPLQGLPMTMVWARDSSGGLGLTRIVWESAPTSAVDVGLDRTSDTSGVILDEDERPVPGALVRIAATDVESRSGETGQFTLRPGVGGAVVVEREGLLLSRLGETFLLGGWEGRLRIPTRTALTIHVVEQSGSGISDVTLDVYGREAEVPEATSRYVSRAKTDGEGRARLPVLPGRIDRVVVIEVGGRVTFDTDDGTDEASPGFGLRGLANPIGAGEVRAVTLALPPGISVRGRALWVDGRPAPRARIAGSSTGFGRDVHDVATADGRFRLRRLHVEPVEGTSDEASVRVEVDGVARRELELTARQAEGNGGEIDLGDVVLQPAAMLRGRVVDADGAPVAGARVRAGRFGISVRTDAQGVFRIQVDPSVSFLTARAPGTRPREVRVRGTVRPGEVRDVEPIFLRRPLTLRVRVTDPGGAPIAGARVRLPHVPADPAAALPQTDRAGAVELPGYGTPATPPFPEESNRLLDLLALIGGDDGLHLQVTRPDGFSVVRKLDVPVGATDPYDLLVVVPERVVVEGVVRDEGGLPAAAVDVKASVEQVSRGARSPHDIGRVLPDARRTTTDAAGRYRLELAAVPGEVWKVSGKHDDGRTASQEVVLRSGAPVDLVLRKADAKGTEGGAGK